MIVSDLIRTAFDVGISVEIGTDEQGPYIRAKDATREETWRSSMGARYNNFYPSALGYAAQAWLAKFVTSGGAVAVSP